MKFSPEYFTGYNSAIEQLRKFAEHVVETIRDFRLVTAKAMVGGWDLYHGGLFFALIADDTLYLKADDDNRGELEGTGFPPSSTSPSHEVTEGLHELDERGPRAGYRGAARLIEQVGGNPAKLIEPGASARECRAQQQRHG